MSLPKIAFPKYPLTLPSGKSCTYRPFTVKEQKVLLLAKETKDAPQITSALVDIVKECTFGGISEKSPIFDFEYAFLMIRSKSISDKLSFMITCDHTVEDKMCQKQIPVSIPIANVVVEKDQNHTSKIMIDPENKIGMVLRYPPFSISSKEKMTETDIIIDCIECIYDSNSMYKSEETPREELVEFVESLTPLAMEKIEEFFTTMPKIHLDVPYTCPECGTKNSLRLESLHSFF